MGKGKLKQAKPKLRILLGAEIAIGPGKTDLLEAIAPNGSISAAAREMRMSYRRAWIVSVAFQAIEIRFPLAQVA